MKIWANTIVNNEENFVWFSIMSVIDFVDQVIVYDTGSTDNTVKIIKEIQDFKKNKIKFTQVGPVSKEEFPKVRQKMLEESKCDWVLILDGDEIWWRDSIKKAKEKIEKEGNEIEGIIVPMVVPVGDIYHRQEEKAGKYELLGRKGHLSLKFISKKIPGLHVDLPYGKEGYFDGENNLVQQRSKLIFLNTPFLHVTHLKRSNLIKKTNKFKYELGKSLSSDFIYPEVLLDNYPDFISSPWVKLSGINFLKAKILTPLRKIKRRIKNG